MLKINISRLKEIIKEEIKRINEADEYKDGSKVMKSSADLITAIKAFKESASESSKAYVDINVLDDLVKKLDVIARNSMNYIDAPEKLKSVVKKAIFKPTLAD
jgi:hypothetical protein